MQIYYCRRLVLNMVDQEYFGSVDLAVGEFAKVLLKMLCLFIHTLHENYGLNPEELVGKIRTKHR